MGLFESWLRFNGSSNTSNVGCVLYGIFLLNQQYLIAQVCTLIRFNSSIIEEILDSVGILDSDEALSEFNIEAERLAFCELRWPVVVI